MADYVTTGKTPIRRCLTTVRKTKVLYVVFSYLTPYKIETTSISYSIASYVWDIWDLYTTHDFNPAATAPHRYYAASQSQGNVFAPFVSLATYRTLPKSTLLYSVWRLDGASLALAQGLVDKAMQAELAGGAGGRGCSDGTTGADVAHAAAPDTGWRIHHHHARAFDD